MKRETQTVITTKEGKVMLIEAWYANTKETKYFGVFNGVRQAISKTRYDQGIRLAS